MEDAGVPQKRDRRRTSRCAGGDALLRAGYSQRVAKVKPTAMKAIPTNRFF